MKIETVIKTNNLTRSDQLPEIIEAGIMIRSHKLQYHYGVDTWFAYPDEVCVNYFDMDADCVGVTNFGDSFSDVNPRYSTVELSWVNDSIVFQRSKHY